jgi:hypothetical protein
VCWKSDSISLASKVAREWPFSMKMSDDLLPLDNEWVGDQLLIDDTLPLVFEDDNNGGIGLDDEAEDNQPVDVPAVIPESQQEMIPIEKSKRNTVSFANRYFMAKSDIFLNSLYKDQFTDESAEIVGQIKQCPREANGRQYIIEWKAPLAIGLDRAWLRTNIPFSKVTKRKIIECMDVYDRSEDGKKRSAAADNTKKATVAKKKQSLKPGRKHQSFQTPVPVKYVTARAALASVKTSSTMSSLSRNSFSSPDTPTTPIINEVLAEETNYEVESVSDDGEDLDEEDNMYKQEYNEADDELGSDEDDDDDISPSGL